MRNPLAIFHEKDVLSIKINGILSVLRDSSQVGTREIERTIKNSTYVTSHGLNAKPFNIQVRCDVNVRNATQSNTIRLSTC